MTGDAALTPEQETEMDHLGWGEMEGAVRPPGSRTFSYGRACSPDDRERGYGWVWCYLTAKPGEGFSAVTKTIGDVPPKFTEDIFTTFEAALDWARSQTL